VHTVMSAGVSARTVLITGAGIIGLMAITVAKAAGAARIYATVEEPFIKSPKPDLFALARHPSLNDLRPNYLDIPDTIFDPRGHTRRGWAGVLYASARQAVAERGRGRRTYIRWFEEQISSLSAATVMG